MEEKLDSYTKFFEDFNITPQEFFKWGIDNTIFPDYDISENFWKDLLSRIYNNQPVYIRGYGRNSSHSFLFIDFYKFVFNNHNIMIDPSNNTKPQKNLSFLTNYKKNVNLFNYQRSHIWGHTKNIFLFEAPWNIAYVPKIIDPFTGHETINASVAEYQKAFRSAAFEKYEKFIKEYNNIIIEERISEKLYDFQKVLNGKIDDKILNRFIIDCKNEFSMINV